MTAVAATESQHLERRSKERAAVALMMFIVLVSIDLFTPRTYVNFVATFPTGELFTVLRGNDDCVRTNIKSCNIDETNDFNALLDSKFNADSDSEVYCCSRIAQEPVIEWC